jgi:hypothetical protein
MKKLRLGLDQLTVDSFDTSTAIPEKGTVFGEQCTCDTACTCPGCATCDHTQCNQETCNGTCYTDIDHATCNGSYTCNPTAYFKYCCPY